MASNKKSSSHDSIARIHSDLLITIDQVYKPSNFTCTKVKAEDEGASYGAYSCEVNGCKIRFRVAKITPKKVGHFVTLWKRVGNGPIQPYDISDDVDFFVISTRHGAHLGHFVFPKNLLREKNIFSLNGHGGKRGIRVYPPWDKPMSAQAQKTQLWQHKYFLEIPRSKPIDYARAHLLYSKV